MTTRVGFLGLGMMGKPMASNVVKGGFSTTVYDVSQEPVKDLVKLGAKASGSPEEVAKVSDVVIIMVRNDAQVEEVALGKKGVLQALSKGSTIIVMSTAAPSLVKKLARECGKKGVGFLDAPVTGVRKVAEGGLTIFVGGDEKLLERHRPVLAKMGENIFHMGAVGSGEIAKLVNNAISIATGWATAEALGMAVKGGADLKKLMVALSATNSSANSWSLQNWDGLMHMKKAFQPGVGAIALAGKDMALFLEAAKEVDQDVPILQCVSQFSDLSKLKWPGPEGWV